MKKLIKLLLIVIWMGLIFSFSSDNGVKSEKKSDSIIIKIYKIFNKEKLTESKKQKIIETYVFPIRKLAHFSEYLILGILVISFIKEFKLLDVKALIIAIIVCLLYAVSDEVHQLFSAGRSGRILDVVIDTIGASVGIMFYYIIYKQFLRRKL